MISVCFQGKPFNITIIQVYAPTNNAEEAEFEQFSEDLQDLLELTPEKEVLFIIGGWNAKEESQETPRVTGKFGLGIKNETGQRLIVFCQENTLAIYNITFIIFSILTKQYSGINYIHNVLQSSPFLISKLFYQPKWKLYAH